MRSLRTALMVTAVVSLPLGLGLRAAGVPAVAPPPPAHAQTGGSADRIIGTYRLVSTEVKDASGKWSQTPSFNSIGYITYSDAGYMAVHIMPKDRPRFAGAQPTPEEAQNAIRGYAAYYGPFTVHEKDGLVIHTRVGKLNPGGPVDYRRYYEFVGNRLILIPADDGRPKDQETRRLIWERLPNVTLSPEAKKFVGFRRLLYTDRQTEKGGQFVSHGEKNEARAGSYIIYTPTGHMMAHLMDKEGRKPYAGTTPTPDEALAAYRGYGGYFGRFMVHNTENPQYVIHQREGMPNPAPPTDVTRFYVFTGHVLRLAPPPTQTATGEMSSSLLYWEPLPARSWKTK